MPFTAYEVLSDAKKRKEYDEGRSSFEHTSNSNFNDFFNEFDSYRRQRHGHNSNKQQFHFDFDDIFEDDDFFSFDSFFGNHFSNHFNHGDNPDHMMHHMKNVNKARQMHNSHSQEMHGSVFDEFDLNIGSHFHSQGKFTILIFSFFNFVLFSQI